MTASFVGRVNTRYLHMYVSGSTHIAPHFECQSTEICTEIDLNRFVQITVCSQTHFHCFLHKLQAVL